MYMPLETKRLQGFSGMRSKLTREQKENQYDRDASDIDNNIPDFLKPFFHDEDDNDDLEVAEE